jgi:hypothetical protein
MVSILSSAFLQYLAAEFQPAAFLPFNPATARELDDLQFRRGDDPAAQINWSNIEMIFPLRMRFCPVG